MSAMELNSRPSQARVSEPLTGTRRWRSPAAMRRAVLSNPSSRRTTATRTTAAMANLAEAIQGLVAHMRTEQQMIREWADGQGEQNREIKKLLERIARQPEKN